MDSSMPWQFRIATLFQNPLTPPQIQMRDPLWRQGDQGFYSADTNVIARARAYDDPEMQAGRQQLILASGANAGVIIEGNDTLPNKSYVLSYADVIMQNAQYINLQTSGINNLLWNSTPFNPRFNTYFSMPLPWRMTTDAFDYSTGVLPAVNTLADYSQALGIDLSGATPFGIYAALTPQKVPLFNGFMAKCLQLLIPFFSSSDEFVLSKTGLPVPQPPVPFCPGLLSTAPGTPVAYSPEFIALATLAMMDLDTPYEASIVASEIGQEVKQLAALSLPGAGAALAVFA